MQSCYFWNVREFHFEVCFCLFSGRAQAGVVLMASMACPPEHSRGLCHAQCHSRAALGGTELLPPALICGGNNCGSSEGRSWSMRCFPPCTFYPVLPHCPLPTSAWSLAPPGHTSPSPHPSLVLAVSIHPSLFVSYPCRAVLHH